MPERIARELRKLAMSTDRAGPPQATPAAPPVAAPAMNWWQRYGTAVMGGLFSVVCLLVSLSWNETSASNKALAATLETMKTSIAEAAAKTDQNSRDVSRVEGETKQLTNRLETGQQQRITNDRDQAAKMAELDNKIAVQATKLDNMNSTLERILRKLEEVRRDGGAPFGERQMWNGLLFSPTIRASLDATSAGGEP